MSPRPPITLNDVIKIAAELNEKMTRTHRHFIYTVIYQHMDGTSMVLHNACLMMYGDWHIIFAEHHLPVIAHKEDVEHIGQYRMDGQIRRIKGKWIKKVRREYEKRGQNG